MIITKEHIGRKVRNNTHTPLTVLAINGDSFWSVDDNGYYETWINDPHWQLVEEAHCSCADQPKPVVLPSEEILKIAHERLGASSRVRYYVSPTELSDVILFLDRHAEVFK